MIGSVLHSRLTRSAESLVRRKETSSERSAAFLDELKTSLPSPSGTRRSLGKIPSTLKLDGSKPESTVVRSPFNPLGLPVQTTLAPTTAQVAADPDKYAGTSFDPTRSITPTITRLREISAEESAPPPPESLTLAEQQQWLQHVSQPPEKSKATGDPNVFITPAGTIWIRPGAGPANATSEDYNRWRLATFGPFPT